MPTAQSATSRPKPPRSAVASCFLLALVLHAHGQEASLTNILGYADRLSVAHGESIQFMVSSDSPTYRADLVRLIHGDVNPAGPGFKEEVVESAVNRSYPGRKQTLAAGSYILVEDHPALRLSNDFTLTAWIAPSTPGKTVQAIVTKFSAADQRGYGIFLGQDGALELWIGDPDGRVETVRTNAPLRKWTAASAFRGLNQSVSPPSWYFVAASFHAASGRATLYQEPVVEWPLDPSRAKVDATIAARSVGQNSAPFLIAGYLTADDEGAPSIGGHFNGKIENPRVFNRVLGWDELAKLNQGAEPREPVAAWDFSADIQSRNVSDTSANRLHGRTVQMPTRGVTSRNWDGGDSDFKRTPKHYAAIHFHDDDLDDAAWQPDFKLQIPESLRSGIYAMRLTAGAGAEAASDYVPFFVRPGPDAERAPIAFLAPTFTYLAYGNWNRGTPELLSLYSHHSDGSGVSYASSLRPILDMKPKVVHRNAGPVTTGPHGFNADLHLVDWLDAKGYYWDVVTDGDLHAEGVDLLTPYQTLITGSHPEYWSGPMLDALKAYLQQGGKLLYLGGNGFYWVTSLDEEGHTIEIRRRAGTEAWQAAPGEYNHSTTGELGGLWRFRGRPPQQLLGVGFTAQGDDRGRPYRRQEGSFDPRAEFIFEGIDNNEPIGDFPCLVLEHGAAGLEVDRFDHVLGTPSHALLLATADGFSDLYQHVVEEVLVTDSKQGGTQNPRVRADMSFMEYPNGGAVFSVGSISWDGCLSYNGYDNNVSRITENVLNHFHSKPDPK